MKSEAEEKKVGKERMTKCKRNQQKLMRIQSYGLQLNVVVVLCGKNTTGRMTRNVVIKYHILPVFP